MEIRRRRERVARAWALDDELVLVEAGRPIGIPGGMDQVYRYRPHPDYYFLTEDRRPGGVLAFDPNEGWKHFLPRVTVAEQYWTGQVPHSYPDLDDLAQWLKQRSHRPLARLGVASGECDRELSQRLELALLHARRPKDPTQLERMRRAARATAAGHARLVECLAPGVSERALQIELEAEFFRAGGDDVAYHTIVLAGARSAILHGHPGATPVKPGEFVLVDAGAEVEGYASDVTRTHLLGPSEGRRQALYQLVLEAQKAALAECRPGREFSDLHLQTAHRLAAGLVELDLWRGSAQQMVEMGGIDLFFPHGLGHMVGMGVRDAGGWLPGRKAFATPGGTQLRLNLPLEVGYVVTIEPGLYFIKPLLQSSDHRQTFAQEMNWEEVDRWLEVGGVRIEDNLLITAAEPENLTEGIAK
ncbi:MAG: M24 family metallopeptidase [Vulcanimicrobiota bacterium]